MNIKSRREFLRKVGIIVAGSSLAPYLKLNVLKTIARAVVPEASANEASKPVDFVIDIAVRAAFPFGDLFPPSGFLSNDINPDRGIIYDSGVSTVQAGSGRILNLTQPAADAGLSRFAPNIGYFESGYGFENFHTSIWSSRIGGARAPGDGIVPPGAGSTFAPMFAAEIAKSRANAPSIPGVLMSRGGVEEVYAGYPNLLNLDSIETLKGLFKSSVPLIGRTEMETLVDTLKRVNAIQEKEVLQFQLQDASNARLAAGQGLDLIVKNQADTIQNEFDSNKIKFGVGSTIATDGSGNVPNPTDFGAQLLACLIGFKFNLFGSAAIHLRADHMHLPEDYQSQRAKDRNKFIADRLGALLDSLASTPHPYRQGAMLFDNTLIVMTSEGQRGVLFRDPEGRLNWDDFERYGAVFIGGSINGGYLGDVAAPGNNRGTTLGFDFNTGALASNNKPSPSSIYRTVCELMKIPPQSIIRNMQMGDPNAPILNAFIKS